MHYDVVVIGGGQAGLAIELETSRGSHEANHVVVATGPFQVPVVPPFAADLGPGVAQLHSSAHRNPAQFSGRGDVVVAGAWATGFRNDFGMLDPARLDRAEPYAALSTSSSARSSVKSNTSWIGALSGFESL